MCAWGILAPEIVEKTRRLQNLQLDSAVRAFNQRSVPDIGNMWFFMPLIWSVIAIDIASRQRNASATVIANAIEARMMSIVLTGGNSQQLDGRVHGIRKLTSGKADYKTLSRPGAYVSQPWRVGLAEPLVKLGLASGSRFSSLILASLGKQLLSIDEISRCRDTLESWTRNRPSRKGDDSLLRLSPLQAIPRDASILLEERMFDRNTAGGVRRDNLRICGTGPTSSQLLNNKRPNQIDPDHWIDMRAGAALMDIRQSALKVLGRIEELLATNIRHNSVQYLSFAKAANHAESEISLLRQLVSSTGDMVDECDEPTSKIFVQECRGLSGADLLERLARRDGNVITVREGHVTLGPAADLNAVNISPDDTVADSQSTQEPPFATQLVRLGQLNGLTKELAGLPNPNFTKNPTKDDE